MRHAIGTDGVHADHHQRERPTPATQNVNQQVEPRQQQEAPAAAEEHPAWRPDALDHRAEAQPAQCRARRQPNRAGSGQPSHFRPRRAVAAHHTAGDQAQDHCAERRDEAERGITTAVEGERLFARKQVEEPSVEGPRGIAVFVPVRREAGHQVRPGV